MFNYIDSQGQKQFKQFKYKSSDVGITYEYLWSPMDQWIIKFFPTWIAPNTITLVAFLILVVTHILFVSGCNGSEIATWRLVLMGVCIILYQHLDNLDGKQARRTKSSTPLGMLFDHGADSVTTFFISIQMLELFQIHSAAQKILSLFLVVMLTYFAAMWAQYSTGVFKLGRINPVDEGLPGFALAAFAAIFIPIQYLSAQHWFGPINQQIMFVLYLLQFPIVYNMSKNNYKNPLRPISEINKLLILPISYLIAIGLLYFSVKCPFDQGMWPIYYCLMFSWARNMIQIQLCFVTKQIYNPINAGSLSFILPSLLFLIIDVDANSFFWIVAIINGIVFMEFVVSVVRQSAKVLNIQVFSITKQSTQ